LQKKIVDCTDAKRSIMGVEFGYILDCWMGKKGGGEKGGRTLVDFWTRVTTTFPCPGGQRWKGTGEEGKFRPVRRSRKNWL